MSKKIVICKSGEKGVRQNLNEIYDNFKDFELYDSKFNITQRLGYKSKYKLWRDNPTWKYYANPESTKSQKNFDNEFDAKRHLAEKRKGVVRHVPGKVKACLYCSAFTICTQKDYLIETGELVI